MQNISLQLCQDANSSSVNLESQRFQFYVGGVLLSIVCVVGVVLNILCALVFSHAEMYRASINRCLFALAIFDCFVLILGFLVLGLSSIHSYIPSLGLGHSMNIISYYLYAVGWIAQCGSVWTTVAIACMRYIAICKPLHALRLNTHRRTELLLCGIAGTAVLYNLVRFFELKLQDCVNEKGEMTIEVSVTELWNNALYKSLYYTWFYSLCVVTLPYLTLLTVNSLMLIEVRRCYHRRKNMTYSERKDLHLNVMLTVIVLLFIICNAPSVFANFYELSGYDPSYTVHVSNVALMINASSNFFIYVAFSTNFRLILRGIFKGQYRSALPRTFASIAELMSVVNRTRDESASVVLLRKRGLDRRKSFPPMDQYGVKRRRKDSIRMSVPSHALSRRHKRSMSSPDALQPFRV